MKYTVIVVLSMLLLCSCGKPTSDNETSTDSTAYGEYATSDPVEEYADEPSSEPLREVIDYYGSIDDSMKMAMASFAPLEKVLAVSRRAIYYKDSLERVRETTELTDPGDSALFMPKMNEALAEIMAYQAAMKQGARPADRCPKLTDIVRTPGESDKSSEFLPEARETGLLSNGNFFFMGGAPFINRDNESTYLGSDGKPEIHYTTSITENANYLFNSLYHYAGGPVTISFGGPLNSYESGDQEVNGIGSLLHSFVKPVPVFFITDEGPVRAQLISVNIKLVPEGMGCISDSPFYTFSSGNDLDPNDILGIFVPYSQMSLDKLQVNRIQTGVWTLDLDGDGVSEIACVSGLFEGISSDEMHEVLWFVNTGGEWRILDWGADLDCT